MSDISVSLGKLKLENPTVLASGILGTSKKLLERIADKGAGAVTIKSLTLEPRMGHNSPVIIEINSGLINAVGYKNSGIELGIKEFSGWTKKIPLIMSIAAKDKNEFSVLAKKISDCAGLKFSALEIALSCLHTPGFGTLAGQSKPEATLEITKAVKEEIFVPLIVKLSPSSPELGETAKAAEKGGADIINMGNTAGPGMVIDIERKRPILHFKFGGMSGPAIRPIAVRCVYDVYESVDIPIIGTGGVTTGKDAIEMLMAGASAVGVGTAVHYDSLGVFNRINSEISAWLSEHDYKNIKEIIGVVHE